MATIFLDMDGVVADFDGYAHRELGIETKPGIRFSQEDWYRLRDHSPRIYSIIPVLPNAHQLVDQVKQLAKQHDYDIKFLTAIPKENDMGWAFWDKIKWVEKNFTDIPVWFGPYSNDKKNHYKPGDILIDDRIKNIEEWPGFCILHQGDVDATIKKLVDSLAC